MITQIDLFGRPCLTKNERQIVDAARKTAANIFKNRDSYGDTFKGFTEESIEQIIIDETIKKLDNEKHERKLAKITH